MRPTRMSKLFNIVQHPKQFHSPIRDRLLAAFPSAKRRNANLKLPRAYRKREPEAFPMLLKFDAGHLLFVEDKLVTDAFVNFVEHGLSPNLTASHSQKNRRPICRIKQFSCANFFDAIM